MGHLERSRWCNLKGYGITYIEMYRRTPFQEAVLHEVVRSTLAIQLQLTYFVLEFRRSQATTINSEGNCKFVGPWGRQGKVVLRVLLTSGTKLDNVKLGNLN